MLPILFERPRIRRAVAWAGRLEEATVIVLFAAMVVIVSLQVFMRYALNSPFLWGEIAARLVFTWVTFLGAALAFKYSYHIQINFLVNLLPEPARQLAERMARAIVVVLLLLLIIEGFQYVLIAWPQRVAPFEFSYATFAASIPVSAMLMLVHVLLPSRIGPADGPPGTATPQERA